MISMVINDAKIIQNLWNLKSKNWLFIKNSNSFSILVWANKAKSDVNGLLPLYPRVAVMGKWAEISLKKKVNPAKWDAKTGFMRGGGSEARTVNNHIHWVSEEIFRIYSKLQQADNYISAEEIKIYSQESLLKGVRFWGCLMSITMMSNPLWKKTTSKQPYEI